MYLKELTIYGFKSFGTKSQLDFIHQGKIAQIAAIVGPNGSGKSNIADAVRWVLGEQSSGLLRGKKTEDVIFFGSEKHHRGSYAEIALTLAGEKEITVEINDKKLDFKEIEIARKLYRSGDSEYLINRRRARLVDIQQLMASLGFGQSTYSIIGQGMVDRLLFFNPTDRKNLFDEAAGIKQHKIKRDLAKKKLIQTEDNLVRLHDLLNETEPQLINLRRLVKRAEGRANIEKELTSLIERYFGTTLYFLNQTIAQDKSQLQEVEEKITKYEKKITEISATLPLGNDQIFDRKTREKHLLDLNEKRDGLIRQISYLEAKKEQVEKQAGNFDQDREELIHKTKKLEQEIKSLKALPIDEKIVALITETQELENKTNKLAGAIEKINQDISTIASSRQGSTVETKLAGTGGQPSEEGLRLEISNREEKKRGLLIEKKLGEEKRVLLKESLSEVTGLLYEIEGKKEELIAKKRATEALCQKEEKELQKISQEADQLNKTLRNEVSKLSPASLVDFENQLAETEIERKTLYQRFQGNSKEENSTLLSEKIRQFLERLENVINKSRALTEAANDQKRQSLTVKIEKIRTQALVKSNELAELAAKRDITNQAIEAIKQKFVSREKEKIRLKSELKELQDLSLLEKNNQLQEIEKELIDQKNRLAQMLRDQEREHQETQKLLGSKIRERERFREELAELNREKYRLGYEKQRYEDKKTERERLLGNLIEESKATDKKLEELTFTKLEDNDRIEEKLLEAGSALLRVEEELASEQEKLNKILEQNQLFQKQYLDKEKAREELSSQLNNLKDQTIKLAVSLASTETKREDLQSEVKIYTERTIIESAEELTHQERDMIRARIENLRRKKESIGEVDQDTLREYNELEERSNDLKKQLVDLESARNDLDKVTEELDRKITRQFNKTFQVIAGEFNRFFALLFNGGRADLQLETDEEGKLGIEIVANPPGKKVHNLTTLSGGERALTSLALIFAILATNPSPFCVLDEVDASLDEVNTGRFVKILTSLSKKTQFLLISHNRETMRIADTLYGITMDDNHLSKIISLRLTEALSQEELTKSR